MESVLVIGEKINVMSKSLGPAMKDREAEPIVEMAKSQVDRGANMLDINIGPASKGGPEMMEWLVKTVQEAVDAPLSLDTTNPEAMEAGLKVHKGQALINSTTGQRERMDAMLPLAAKYDAKIIGLTMTEAGIPRDANERVAVAVEIFTEAMGLGINPENIYLDPLVLPINVAQAQQPTTEVLEAVRMFKQLNDPPLKTVVGLSNISNGAAKHTKSYLDAALVAHLMACGLDAAIMDPMDALLMAVLKTGKLFRNDMLYADSYLDDELQRSGEMALA